MTLQTDCPDRNTLDLLLLGKLPPNETDLLAEHLLDCDSCARIAETIDATDDVIVALASEESLHGEEEIVARVIQRGKRLCSQAETSEIGETLIGKDLPQPASARDASTDSSGTNLDEEIDFLAPAEMPDEIGRLGDYRVLELLGVGGMGVVFLAEDPKLERLVALKAMQPAAAASRSAKARFLREAKATASIEHENIVHIYQVGEDRGVAFIAMQFLRGESLQECLKREKKLDQRQVLRIGREVAAGLDAAHQRKLIHRDIKPDNIWIEEKTGRAKILDFGLVRAATDDAGLTQTGVVLGTPKYMAPEQAQGQSVDHRCDLFSLGSVLYHLATGKAPFEGGNITATLVAVAREDPEPLDSLSPEIDPDLARLIARLLSKDRDERPQMADEVAETIGEIEARMDADPSPAAQQPSLAPTESLPQIQIRSSSEERNTSPKRKRVSPSTASGPHKGSGHTRWRFGLVCSGAAVALLAAVVFFVQTEDGAIRLEINDPSIEVAIKGTDITLRQADGGKDVKLSPGEHTLVVQRDGFKFETNTLILKKGETVTVRVDLLADRIQVRQGERLIGDERLSPRATGSASALPLAIAPFNAEQARQHQQGWADHLGVPVWKDVDLGVGVKITMALIPPGEFMMGSTDDKRARWLKEATQAKDQPSIDRIPSEGPRHRVRLTEPFYLAVHEVTQEQYQRVMGDNPSHFSSEGAGKETVSGRFTHRLPVENVSWLDAVSFCNKLSSLQKRLPCYVTSDSSVTRADGRGYRLPTEAEWEYACRAGSITAYCCSDESELGSYAWDSASSGGKTHPVGEKLPNGFGVHDMHGNVWEWCWDWDDAKYYEKFNEGGDVLDPFGAATGSYRVIRGGGWGNRAGGCRSASRSYGAGGRDGYLGFRLASVLVEE